MQITKHFNVTSLRTSLLTTFMFLGFASNAYGMQICQMTDTLVWELEKGFDIDPADIEEYSEGYDVVVDDGVLYFWETIEGGGKQILTPVEFDKHGKAERNGGDVLWFKVSETEFRVLDRQYGLAWHSKLICPDEG